MFTNDEYTKLEEGDVVVCTFSKDNHFIIGKEYKVIADGWGEPMLVTEYLHRSFLRPKQGGYCSTNLDNHWFYKKGCIVVIDKNTETDLKIGDTVVCVKSRDEHFIGGKEYKVYATGIVGEMMVLTEMSQRYALRPKQGGYCSTNLGEHWFRKKEVVVDSEFKVGEKVFTLNREFGIVLATVFSINGNVMVVEHGEGDLLCHSEFTRCGKHYVYDKIKSVIKATSENRKALARFHGEDVVPKLELSGGEAVKNLLKRQKYVLCQVSNFSETHARKGDVVALIDSADILLPEGSFYDGGDDWDYAVPIDMNKKEIVINLVEEK